jgi:hypothetical protein
VSVYYCVERPGAGWPVVPGACYGSSLVRAEADAALVRATARGMTSLVVAERASRPDVAGWLTPCHEVAHGQRVTRRRRKAGTTPAK